MTMFLGYGNGDVVARGTAASSSWSLPSEVRQEEEKHVIACWVSELPPPEAALV